MPTLIFVDTASEQTLTGPKTLTGGIITAGVIDLAAAPTTSLGAATKGYVDGLNTTPLLNASLAAIVSGNILTVNLKTAAGATPSTTDPVRATFRHPTDNDGSLVTRTITGATSLTLASGSSLGMTNGQAARLWVGLLDNAGTVEVCIWNPLNTNSQFSLKAFTPNSDVTTTAEGSGTATSAHVLYSTNARTGVPFILLGFIEIVEATAGVWATAPTVVQTYRDGYKKTGDVIQTQYIQTGAVATGTTAVPYDDTIPQITEGDQYMSQAITPISAVNLLAIRAQAYLSNTNASSNITMALFQDAIANALAAVDVFQATGSGDTLLSLLYQLRAGVTVSTTFRIRAGGSVGATTTFNGAGGVRKFGGVLLSFLEVTEIFV